MHEQQSFSLEDLPFTVYMLAFGVGFLLVGFVIQFVGDPVNAGIAGAFAAVMIALAAVIHVGIWILGRAD